MISLLWRALSELGAFTESQPARPLCVKKIFFSKIKDNTHYVCVQAVVYGTRYLGSYYYYEDTKYRIICITIGQGYIERRVHNLLIF